MAEFLMGEQFFSQKEHSFTITEFVAFQPSRQAPQSSQTPGLGEWI